MPRLPWAKGQQQRLPQDSLSARTMNLDLKEPRTC